MNDELDLTNLGAPRKDMEPAFEPLSPDLYPSEIPSENPLPLGNGDERVAEVFSVPQTPAETAAYVQLKARELLSEALQVYEDVMGPGKAAERLQAADKIIDLAGYVPLSVKAGAMGAFGEGMKLSAEATKPILEALANMFNGSQKIVNLQGGKE